MSEVKPADSGSGSDSDCNSGTSANDSVRNCHIVLTLGKAGVLVKSLYSDTRQCTMHMQTPGVSSTHAQQNTIVLVRIAID
jgi:hypothetical protein